MVPGGQHQVFQAGSIGERRPFAWRIRSRAEPVGEPRIFAMGDRFVEHRPFAASGNGIDAEVDEYAHARLPPSGDAPVGVRPLPDLRQAEGGRGPVRRQRRAAPPVPAQGRATRSREPQRRSTARATACPSCEAIRQHGCPHAIGVRHPLSLPRPVPRRTRTGHDRIRSAYTILRDIAAPDVGGRQKLGSVSRRALPRAYRSVARARGW